MAKARFTYKLAQLLSIIITLLFCVSAVHSLAVEYKGESIPGKTPKGVKYSQAKAVKAPHFGGQNGLRFAMFGDWGMKTNARVSVAKGLHKLQKQLKKKKQGLTGVLLSGDNFYSKGVESLKDPKWESLWGKDFRKVDVPFYVSLGNHDYGFGVKGAQIQVQKSGRKGFELWKIKDSNGSKELGIYYSQWFSSPDFACQICFIDTSVLLFKPIQSYKAWGKQLHWLSRELGKRPPKKDRNKTVVRMVIGHHLLQSFGEKEGEVKFIHSAKSRLGPKKTGLGDIVLKKADIYLCGHAHTVQFIHLGGKKVAPSKGPIHGKTRRLSHKEPLELCSGTGAQVRRKSFWGPSSYYVAHIPGFTVIALEKKKDRPRLIAHFVDCRSEGRGEVIYSLDMPLGKRRAY